MSSLSWSRINRENHRRPKMPDSFLNPKRGMCRWCGLPVLNANGVQVNRGRCWHPACVTIYRVACFSDDQRQAVLARDGGICARCGCDAEKVWNDAVRAHHADRTRNPFPTGAAWEADHIRPLIEAEGRIEFFLLSNLQTLCRACHVQKGKEDRHRQKTCRAWTGPETVQETLL